MKLMITIAALMALAGSIAGFRPDQSNESANASLNAPPPTVTVSNDTVFYREVETDKQYRWRMDINISDPCSFERTVHFDPDHNVVLIKLKLIKGDEKDFRNFRALRYDDRVINVARCILKIFSFDGTTELATLERFTKGAVFEKK